jgi:hypothetical protein
LYFEKPNIGNSFAERTNDDAPGAASIAGHRDIHFDAARSPIRSILKEILLPILAPILCLTCPSLTCGLESVILQLTPDVILQPICLSED